MLDTDENREARELEVYYFFQEFKTSELEANCEKLDTYGSLKNS